MNNGEKQRPGNSARGIAAKREREERSAKALRDNLRRRKMQARQRADELVDEKNTTDDSPDRDGDAES